MQILVMLIFLVVWLLFLWAGSIALEATGLERSKSRFQALSALTGTGFTTSQAEAIVEHPKRRKITTYLIFIGNTGIVAFILLVILYARAGLTPPSTLIITVTIAVLIIIGLAFWLGPVDKLTSGVLKLTGNASIPTNKKIRKIFHQAGDYAIAQIAIGEQARLSDFQQKDISVFAIERGDTVFSFPQPEENLVAGDYILCYGKLASINNME